METFRLQRYHDSFPSIVYLFDKVANIEQGENRVSSYFVNRYITQRLCQDQTYAGNGISPWFCLL